MTTVLSSVARFGARVTSARLRSTLVGRDIVDLRDLLHKDLKSLLWAALDFKNNSKTLKRSKILQGRHVTLLLSQPDPFTQASMGRAVNGLGAGLTTIVDKSLENMDSRSVEDLGRALSTSSDVILVQTEDHSFISKIADGANVPTVAWRSEKYATFQALADILTVYEHFNVLSPLTLSWVGPSTALFNSYLFIMPRMKINLRYCCYDSDSNCKISPAMMSIGVQNSILNKTEIHECLSPAEAVRRTDIIVTTGHDIPSLSLIKKDVDEASLEYILLHDLPRGQSEISDELFRSEHSAIWKSRENILWIAKSVLVNLTEEYRPSITQPKWEIE